jgi:hypothetical protein
MPEKKKAGETPQPREQGFPITEEPFAYSITAQSYRINTIFFVSTNFPAVI